MVARTIDRVPQAAVSDSLAGAPALVMLMMLVTGCFLIVGCKGSSGSQRKTDSTLQRFTKRASTAYAEGQVEQAITEYRKAIRRAWALDEPYESGTAAYNLAACLMSNGNFTEAKDWLLDARVELHRSGSSTGNVWILEAKIAQAESRFEDADCLVRRASRTSPPCPDDSCALCAEDDPCGDSCVAKIPCVGEKIKSRQDARDCRRGYEAQLALIRARSAAEQYDLPCAKSHLERACELAEGICSYDLQAELHDVAALIHIAKGEFLQAGRHLDREAVNLRLAGNYREIPGVLELASASYEQAGLVMLAADRLCRAARIWFGRGDNDRAWQLVQQAGPLTELACAEATKIRLALLANEILLAISENGEAAPAPTNDGDEGMLAPLEGPMEDPAELLPPDQGAILEPDFAPSLIDGSAG